VCTLPRTYNTGRVRRTAQVRPDSYQAHVCSRAVCFDGMAARFPSSGANEERARDRLKEIGLQKADGAATHVCLVQRSQIRTNFSCPTQCA
jgi:hypothetical protein